MQTTTIKKLNQINTAFYQQIASQFSQTRQHAWQGWSIFLPLVKELCEKRENREKREEKSRNERFLSVLDVGCGNGRFLSFLLQHFPDKIQKYLGIDNSRELLAIARDQFAQLHFSSSGTLIEFREHDLISSSLTQTNAVFSLITVFGVLHHVPSFALRKKLLHDLCELLEKGGVLIVSAWQFTRDEQLMKRHVPATELGIAPEELEAHDYFLTWERGVQATRYCHWVNAEEMHHLLYNLPLKILSSYSADGKEGNLNLYFVLQKQ